MNDTRRYSPLTTSCSAALCLCVPCLTSFLICPFFRSLLRSAFEPLASKASLLRYGCSQARRTVTAGQCGYWEKLPRSIPALLSPHVLIWCSCVLLGAVPRSASRCHLFSSAVLILHIPYLYSLPCHLVSSHLLLSALLPPPPELTSEEPNLNTDVHTENTGFCLRLNATQRDRGGVWREQRKIRERKIMMS